MKTLEDVKALVEKSFPENFTQLNLWNNKEEIQLKMTKKGKLLSHRQPVKEKLAEKNHHNREKNSLLPQGIPIPPLVDMKVMTNQGTIIKGMEHKFRQINRFLEMVEDTMAAFPIEKPISIVDFGCGKSYLTFVLYYYFTQIQKRSVTMVGLDLKKEVIENCNKTSQKYGYQHLSFLQGNIKDYKTKEQVDMVVSLHACNTATDFALYFGIINKAKAILSVPCCQHELNQQMESDAFRILTRYGIVKERTAALMTDAIRGNLLTYCGYKTQLLEFIELEHTPKNILLRAVKAPLSQSSKEEALREVTRLCEAFSFEPTLLTLIKEGKPL